MRLATDDERLVGHPRHHARQRRGRCRRIEFWVGDASFLQFLDVARIAFDEHVAPLAPLLTELRHRRRHLLEHETQAGVAPIRLEIGPVGCGEDLGGVVVGTRLHVREARMQHVLVRLGEDGVEDLFLAVEVGVERPDRALGLSGDVGEP